MEVLTGMTIVGLTGGIASGKSTVTRRLLAKGYPVIDLDELAREVVQPGRRAHRRIVAEFGEEVTLPDGSLDRKALGDKVFADPKLRRRLNSLTHTDIVLLLAWRLAQHWWKGSPVVFVDAPLLFESGLHHICSRRWLVACNEDTQRARLMARDGLAVSEAQSRIDAQMPLAKKMAMPRTRVLQNDGSLSELSEKVDDALTSLRPPRPNPYAAGWRVLLLGLGAVWLAIAFYATLEHRFGARL